MTSQSLLYVCFHYSPFAQIPTTSTFSTDFDETCIKIHGYGAISTSSINIKHGSTSEKLDVLSWVPQGTVLGPLLLVYINDLPTVCKTSQANLFAGDTLLYQHIRNDEDSAKLQEDLTVLEDWESMWQMSFHPEKFTVLRVTTSKRYRRETNYILHGQCLEVTDSAKYLGVTLSDDLQWEKHTQATAAKASRTLGFLRRNFRDYSKQVRTTTYKSMVRPTMEYASTYWNPCKTEDVNCLDNVQAHTPT